ncbi:molecular chaperone [Deinococcus sp. Arct2-2]|uniref:fimbrial biogenesis chaperone n=1 Tax=Deinococcus sp. Arct2-2 TaxID=2568653 RepID=UPI0010A55B28|nr:fimbria/pilus periplasmic chaperone [Deinococcus sp. Arct2-2]THF70030.1 molecular chaperone [Deinococcus sp. Arct2-2]
MILIVNWSFWRTLLLALGLFLGVSAAQAQGFGVAPTVLNINARESLNTSATLFNTTARPARFAVTLKSWKMVDGQTVLADTRDLLINPTTFTIPAGSSQILRVGLRKNPTNEELTYRILIQQLPLEGSMAQIETQQPNGITTNLNLALGFSVPIYVASPAMKSAVQYAVQREGSDLMVKVTNQGNRHATFNGLAVVRDDQKVDIQSFAVLSGATFTLRIPGLAEKSGQLKFTFRNEDGVTVNDLISVP